MAKIQQVTDSDEKKADSPTESNEIESPSDSLTDIADTLADAMPEVQEHAIQQEEARQSEIAERYAGLVDKDGLAFDPNIHKTDGDGNPILTGQGKLSRKPGRRSGGKTSDTGTRSQLGVSSRKAQGKQDSCQSETLKARASGVAAANAFLGICSGLGGEEWMPYKDTARGIDERAHLEMVFADYFEATGKTDIPPGWALTIGLFGYVAPRFTMPKTKSRAKSFALWIGEKWESFRNRRKFKNARKVAPAPKNDDDLKLREK